MLKVFDRKQKIKRRKLCALFTRHCWYSAVNHTTKHRSEIPKEIEFQNTRYSFWFCRTSLTPHTHIYVETPFCTLYFLNLLCLTQILLSNIVNFKPVYVRCDVVCNERIQTPDWNLAWISNNTLHTHLKVGNFLENRFSRTPHIWCYRTKMF